MADRIIGKNDPVFGNIIAAHIFPGGIPMYDPEYALAEIDFPDPAFRAPVCTSPAGDMGFCCGDDPGIGAVYGRGNFFGQRDSIWKRTSFQEVRPDLVRVIRIRAGRYWKKTGQGKKHNYNKCFYKLPAFAAVGIFFCIHLLFSLFSI
jgi:hypothetical protein